MSYNTCNYWYGRFKNSDSDLSDRKRPGQPSKFKDDELQELIDKDPAQTQKEIAAHMSKESFKQPSPNDYTQWEKYKR